LKFERKKIEFENIEFNKKFRTELSPLSPCGRGAGERGKRTLKIVRK
jgi:hypothetical protein